MEISFVLKNGQRHRLYHDGSPAHLQSGKLRGMLSGRSSGCVFVMASTSVLVTSCRGDAEKAEPEVRLDHTRKSRRMAQYQAQRRDAPGSQPG